MEETRILHRERVRQRLVQLRTKLNEKTLSLTTRTYTEIVEIPRTEEALLRVEDGTYGLCQACGELIAEKRLLAIPEIPTCKSCEQPEQAFKTLYLR